MKRFILNTANALLQPFGAQIYRRGIDMQSVLKVIAGRNPGFKSIIDLGAARGHWSEAALALFSDAQVIGVDPLKEREPFLAKLKARNPRYDYVLAVAGAEDGGSVELAVTGDLDGSTVHGAEGEKRVVPVHTLDAIIASKGLKGPFFLKFDTHGFERPILDGAEKTLAETSYIVMESYNFRHTPETMLFHEMIAFLEGKGFRVFNMADPLQRPHDRALWQMDLFFARADDPVFNSNSFRG